jgi:hypothetical protein
MLEAKQPKPAATLLSCIRRSASLDLPPNVRAYAIPTSPVDHPIDKCHAADVRSGREERAAKLHRSCRQFE